MNDLSWKIFADKSKKICKNVEICRKVSKK